MKQVSKRKVNRKLGTGKKEINVRFLTNNQAIVLLSILNNEPFKFRRNRPGGSLSALERSGYIMPLGRFNRNLNWEPVKEFDIKEIEIIKKIARLTSARFNTKGGKRTGE